MMTFIQNAYINRPGHKDIFIKFARPDGGNTINGKHITIKPSAMWKETDNNKVCSPPGCAGVIEAECPPAARFNFGLALS